MVISGFILLIESPSIISSRTGADALPFSLEEVILNANESTEANFESSDTRTNPDYGAHESLVAFCPTIALQAVFNPFGGGAGAPDFMLAPPLFQSLIPLSQPYNSAPWNYAGTETLAAIPGNMVDWILMVIRDGADPNVILGQAAGVLLSDGSITDVGGDTIKLDVPSVSGYYLEVVHRNHLSITSPGPLLPDPMGNICWDFTTGMTQAFVDPVLNDDPQVPLPGIFGLQFGMIAGNVQSLDKQIDANDIKKLGDAYLSVGAYLNEDVNMDGNVDANDINLSFTNYNSNGHCVYSSDPVNCASCNTSIPDYVLKIIPQVIPSGGGTTSALLHVYLQNLSSQALTIRNLEFSLGINETNLSSLDNMTSDAPAFGTQTTTLNPPFTVVIDQKSPFSNPNFTSLYEYDHTSNDNPLTIPAGAESLVLTTTMAFDGTQTFVDDDINDPMYLGSPDFIVPIHGDCIDYDPNINNQWCFMSNGSQEVNNCFVAITPLSSNYNFFIVTNTNCTGPGSLHQAVLDAQAAPDPPVDTPHLILFNLPPNSTVCTENISLNTSKIKIQGTGIDNLTLQGSLNNRGFILTDSACLSICDLTIEGAGHPQLSGGAIVVEDSAMLDASRVRFKSNLAEAGGAIRGAEAATVVVDSCVFESNVAMVWGGAINSGEDPGQSITKISRSIFRGNRAGARGGALFIDDGKFEMDNAAFSGNGSLDRGGAIYNINRSDTTKIFSCSIGGNVTGSKGGGIYNTGVITMGNTIVAKNLTFDQGPDIFNKSSATDTLISSGGNLIGDHTDAQTVFPAGTPNGTGDWVGTSGGPLDPFFVLNPDPIADSLGGDLRLKICSPAINNGNNAILAPEDSLDLDGNDRIYMAGVVDIGAYEFQGDGLGITSYINTYPYLETFETFTLCGNNFDPCNFDCKSAVANGWLQDDNDGDDWRVDASTTPSGGTGPSRDNTTGTATGKYLYTEASVCNGVTSILVSPVFDVSSLSTPTLSFWIHMFGANMGTMQVEMRKDCNQSWQPLWSLSGEQQQSSDEEWINQEILLDNTADLVQLRWIGITGPGFASDMALDDIKIFDDVIRVVHNGTIIDDGDRTPTNSDGTYFGETCSMVMDSFYIKNVGDGVLTIDTIKIDPNGANPGGFSYNEGNYTFPQSIPVGDSVLIKIIFNPITDGPDTASVCIQYNGGSIPYTFLVAGYKVPVIGSFPYVEDFETFGLCGNNFDPCNFNCKDSVTVEWFQSFLDDDDDWRIDNSNTPSGGTGPMVDHTLGTIEGQYLFTEASGCNGVTSILESPLFNLTGIQSPAVEFYIHMFGDDMGTMKLEVQENCEGPWSEIWSISSQQQTASDEDWIAQQVSLGSLGTNIRLRWIGITGPGFESDMALDDIRVYDEAEIQISNNGTIISNNDFTPSAGDGTDFGDACGMTMDSFYIKNVLTGDLIVDTIKIDAYGSNIGAFSYNEMDFSFPVTILGGDSLLLKIIFNPAVSAPDTALVCIGHDDGDQNPYTFLVSGMLDTTAPVASCQDITIFLDKSGNVSITPDQIDNGTADNCGNATFMLDKSSFTCADLGMNTVIMTATDGNGNTDTCHAVVTVEDIQISSNPNIVGLSPFCPGMTNVPYSVIPDPDVTSYQWSYSGAGATILGNGSSSININFANNATAGTLTVEYVTACGPSGIKNNFSVVEASEITCALAFQCPETLLVINTMINFPAGINLFKANTNVTSAAQVETDETVLFRSGSEVNLLPNFEVELGAVFGAEIQGCNEALREGVVKKKE